jgi:hypothetical protein
MTPLGYFANDNFSWFFLFFVKYSLEQGQPPEREIRELAEGSIDMKGDSL